MKWVYAEFFEVLDCELPLDPFELDESQVAQEFSSHPRITESCLEQVIGWSGETAF